jgi:hypothetical protein
VASLTYDEGAFAQEHQDKSFLADTVEFMLVTSAYTPAAGDTLADAAAFELAVSGYARKTLAAKTLTLDAGTHRTIYDAGNPSQYTLAAGATVGGAVVFFPGTVDDTDALAFFFVDCPNTATNGGTFDFAFHASGIGYTQR